MRKDPKNNRYRRAKEARAVDRMRTEAASAIGHIDRAHAQKGTKPRVMKSIPTIVRPLVSIEYSDEFCPTKFPEELSTFFTNIKRFRGNAHRRPLVQVFGRRDSLNAVNYLQLNEGEINERMEKAQFIVQKRPQLDVNITRFAIFGVARAQSGRRFVSGIFDRRTTLQLQYEHNIVRTTLGGENSERTHPFHASVLSTSDQHLAESVRDDLNERWSRDLAVITLGAPELKVVEQDPPRR